MQAQRQLNTERAVKTKFLKTQHADQKEEEKEGYTDQKKEEKEEGKGPQTG